MNSKNLAAWFLIVGPILVFLSFLGWPNAETAQEELAELAKNRANIAIMGVFITGITLLFTGLSIYSRIIAEEKTKWSALTVASGILFPLPIAVMLTSVGLNFGAVRLYETSIDNANSIYLIGYHITDVVGLIMGIPFALLGIALIRRYEDVICKGIGVLYFIIGICHVTHVFVVVDGTDVLGLVSWLGMLIVSLVVGVVVLTCKNKVSDPVE